MTAMKLSVSVDGAWASDDAPATKRAAEGVECAKGDGVTTFKFTASPCLSTSTTTCTALRQGDCRCAPGSLGSSNLQRSSNSSTCTHPVRPAFFYAYRNEPLPAAMLAPYQHASVAQPLLGSIPVARTASAPAVYQQQLYGQPGDIPVASGGARSQLNPSNCPGWVSAAALQQLQTNYESARHGALDALDCMDPCWGLGPGDMDGQESEHSQDSSDFTDPMQEDDDDGATACCHMSARSEHLQRPPLEAQASLPNPGKWPAARLAPHLLLRKTMSAAQLMMGGSPREAAVGAVGGNKSFGGLPPGGMELQRLRSWLSLAGVEAPTDGAAGSGCSSGTAYGVGRRAGSCLRQGSNTSSPRIDSGSSQPFGRHHNMPSRQNSRLVTSEADMACDADVSGSMGRATTLGGLTAEERAAKIQRYRDKRSRRNFGKRGVQYQCRKSLADTRPRVRGRFARDSDPGIVMPHQTKKAQRAAAAAAAAAAKAQRAAAAAAAVAQLPAEYQPDAAAAAAAWVNGEDGKPQKGQEKQKQQTTSRNKAAPKAVLAATTASPMHGATQQANRSSASQSPASTANASPPGMQPVSAAGWDATPPLRSDQQPHTGTSNSTTNNAMPAQQQQRRAAPASLQIPPTQLPRAPLCVLPLQVPPPPSESSLQGLLYSDLLPQLPSSMTGQGACKGDGEVTEADARLAAAFLGLESPGGGAFAITPGSLPMLLNGLPSNGSDPGDCMQLDLNGLVLPCGALVGGGGGQADLLLASLGVTFDNL